MIHIDDTIKNRIIGRNDIKNSLKMAFDGNGPFTSVSVMNQSNDKNVSDDDPTRSAGKTLLTTHWDS